MTPLAALRYVAGVHVAGRAALRWQRYRDAGKLRRDQARTDRELRAPLIATAWMKNLMARHYLAGRHINGVRKVAWVTTGAPIEPLRALGFFVTYPDNHAALCAARRWTERLSAEAEARGYSPDVCSYVRSDIGTMLSGATPVGRLSRPDLLVASSNICQTVLHWHRVFADHYRVPLCIIDTPFLFEEAKPHQVAYVKRQIESMIGVAEHIAGRSLKERQLVKELARARTCAHLWLDILERGRQRPSPISAFDGFIHMGPIVGLRGERETIAYYRAMLAEIDRRIAMGIGAIRQERKRVLWDNLPIWQEMGSLARHLAARGVNIVASTYTYAWAELAPMMDPSQPLDSMARVYLHPFLNRSSGAKLESMRRMIEAFAIDGVILHSDRSCKPYSLGQLDHRARLVGELGIPALLLEADHGDPRAYGREQVTTRLDAFVETLDQEPARAGVSGRVAAAAAGGGADARR